MREDDKTAKFHKQNNILTNEQYAVRDKAEENLDILRTNLELVLQYQNSDKVWQFRGKGSRKWFDYKIETPSWDFNMNDFREKPEPKKIHVLCNGVGDPLMYQDKDYTLDVAISTEGYTHTIYEEVIN